jgi:hypothetical protein
MIAPHALRVIGWAALAVLLTAALLIPVAYRATVCADDFAWITNAWSDPSLAKGLAAAWSNNFFFRPIDILANRLISPRTLDLVPILPVQIAGLLALTAGVWRLLALAGASGNGPRLVATAWLWLHPATQLSVWSAGCSSQTWSAAFGIWIMCEALTLPQERIGWRSVAILTMLSAAGVVAKELFVGWATAAACVIVVRHVIFRRSQNLLQSMKAVLPLVCAVILPPCIWIGLRLWSTRFGEVMRDDSGGLYSLHGPATIVENLAISVLGMFVQGPVHWARLLGLPWMVVPFVGAGLSCYFATLGSTRAGGVVAGVPASFRLMVAVAIGVVAIWPALLIGKVSELYVMGPNALIAALVGIGMTTHDGPAKLGRWIAGLALLLIAVGGYASRSYHFSVTWSQARELREAVDRIADGAPRQGRLVIVVPESLRAAPMHSKYLVPPAVAAALAESWVVKRLADPSLPEVEFLTPGPEGAPAGGAPVLEAPSARRVMW